MSENYEQIRLRFPSKLYFVDISQEAIQKMLEHFMVLNDEVFWISLAIREGLINAVKHGNKFDENKYVELRVGLRGRTLRIEIMDEGKGFEVKDIPNPLDEENLLKPSGRGIFYIRSFMDHVAFSRIDSAGMKVIMEKNVSFDD
jgi:serine/threonine-protein kinase RsbW